MSVDGRLPVIIGVGQVNWEEVPAPEPVDLLAEAARRAAADSGGLRVLDALQSIRVVRMLSRAYRDPGRLAADRLGIDPGHTATTYPGGQMPQALVGQAAEQIQRGEVDLVLVGGAESWKTRLANKRAETDSGWTLQDDDVPLAEVIGSDLAMFNDIESAIGLYAPVQAYPLFENALRASIGRGVEEHQRSIAEFWARFAAVAATNPHAAVRHAPTAEEIRTVRPSNRMVAFPYLRLMVSNERVDQGAAVIVSSAERARALGVPRERWVFVHSVATATDKAMSERAHLGRSAPMRVAGRSALELAGVGPDDLAHVDLYSCFPCAVEIAAAEVGLGLERTLTVTGGLTFAGGPWNNYVSHAISAMTGRLRDDPGALGLVSGNGGTLSKHAFAVYSTEPPAKGFRSADLAAEMAKEPVHPTVAGHDGSATVDTYTVTHDRDSRPERALLAVCTPDGARTWAWSTDADLMEALTRSEGSGRTVRVKGNQAPGLDGP